LFLIIVFLLLASLYPAKGMAFYRVLLSPPLKEIEAIAGTSTTYTMSLRNLGDIAMACQVFVRDLAQKESGEYQVMTKRGEAPFSCADWVEISPEDTDFTLPAEEGRDIPIKLAVPRHVREGGYYAAVVLEIVPPVPEERPLASVALHPQMTSLIELSVKTLSGRGGVKRASISDIEILRAFEDKTYSRKYGQDALVISALVKNEGNVHLFGKGNLTIRTAEGKVLRRTPLGGGRGVVLPGNVVRFNTVFKVPPPPGEYLAEVSIEYGDRYIARVKKEFSIGGSKRSSPAFEEVLGGARFGVTPAAIELEKLPPGSFRTFSVAVHNEEKRPVRISGEVNSVSYDPQGKLLIMDEKDTAWSCASWVSPEKWEFTLSPQEKKHLQFRLEVPKNSQGGKYAYFTFNEVSAEGTRVSPDSPTKGTMLLLTASKDLEAKGEVVNLEVVETEPLEVLASFKNRGNFHLKVNGTMSLWQDLKLIEEGIPLDEQGFTVLPGDVRNAKVTYGKPLLPGSYKVEVNFTFENKGSTAETSFTVK